MISDEEKGERMPQLVTENRNYGHGANVKVVGSYLKLQGAPSTWIYVVQGKFWSRARL
jgi:hypothetical protein